MNQLSRTSKRNLVVMALLFLVLLNCSMKGKGRKGQVFEVANPEAPPQEWRYVPMHNADVVVRWYAQDASKFLAMHGGRYCAKAVILRTKEDGTYDVPGWVDHNFQFPQTLNSWANISAINYIEINTFLSPTPIQGFVNFTVLKRAAIGERPYNIPLSEWVKDCSEVKRLN
jgi:hypothetical protein